MVNPPELSIGVDAQGPLEVMAASLHEFLKKRAVVGGESVTIIDLRPSEEFAQFSIPTSVNLSYEVDMPLAPLAAQLRETLNKGPTASHDSPLPSLLFVSTQSPDIDDMIAREVIREYEKSYGQAPPASAIGILVGGVSSYREQYPNGV